MCGRSTAGGIAGSVFLNLHSLQENLELPFFLSMLVSLMGDTATAAMVCHGGVHHQVKEMGGNDWPSDLERKVDIYTSISELKLVSLSLKNKAWIQSPVAMDDPKTLDLVKELVVYLLSIHSPSPSVDPSVIAATNLPIAGGHGRPQDPRSHHGARCPPPLHPLPLSLHQPLHHHRQRPFHHRWPWITSRSWILSRSSLSTSSPPAPPLPLSTPLPPPPPTFPSLVAMDDPKIQDLIKELVVHLLSTRSLSPSINPSTTTATDLLHTLRYAHCLTLR